MLVSLAVKKMYKDAPQFESKNIIFAYFWIECKPSKWVFKEFM